MTNVLSFVPTFLTKYVTTGVAALLTIKEWFSWTEFFCTNVDSGGFGIELVHDLLQVDLPGLLPGEEPLDVLGSLDVWAAWV